MLVKNLTLAACLFCSLPLHAQQDIYLKPYVGAGFAHVLSKNDVLPLYAGQPITAKQAGINAGYNKGRWRFEIGIAYLESGFRDKDILFNYHYTNLLQPSMDEIGTFNYRFRHLFVPMNIGYVLNLSKNFKLIPILGFGVSYNLGAKYWYVTDNEKLPKVTEDFDRFYRRLSPWGRAQVSIEHNISPNLSVSIDPQFNLMLLSLEKTGNMREQHYTVTTTAGITWWFNKPSKKNKPEQPEEEEQ